MTLPADKPACLGGTPIFQTLRRVAEPSLPPLADLQPELATMWAGRSLTNRGPQAQALGRELAERLGVAVALSASGTAGLMATLRALDIRGEVIVPAYTFPATALSVVWAGARPVFADVDPDTWSLTPERCADRLGPATEAILPVHLFGRPCERAPLEDFAARHGLALIFDAAHAFGSRYPDGTPVGAGGTAEVFSFHATKVLPMGEGGAVATRDDDLAHRADLLTVFGNRGDGVSELPGFNGKMQEWNALLGRHALREVDAWIERRAELVRRYRAALGQLPGLSFQAGHEGATVAHQYFAVRVDPVALGLNVEELRQALWAEGIEGRRYYAPALHHHPAYDDLVTPPLPTVDALADSVICLPLYAHLTDDELDGICTAIHRLFAWRDTWRDTFGMTATAPTAALGQPPIGAFGGST
jgi:dTDP-4-amino-4,6-dideoxygalactose transaminase